MIKRVFHIILTLIGALFLFPVFFVNYSASLYKCIKEYVGNKELRGRDSLNALQLFNNTFSYNVVYKNFAEHIDRVSNYENN